MASIKLANAPCSWGALEFEDIGERQIDYRQMLDELVETGYTGTDLGDWGYMPTDPARLHAELSARHVAMVGAFVPVPLKNAAAHADGIAEAVKIARLLAAVAEVSDSTRPPIIVLADENGTVPQRVQNAGHITPEMGLSNAEWHTFAAGAQAVARAVRDETGLRTAFHHHCAGYVETPAEIDRLLSLTDPALLGLVFDTGHYAFGAGSCAAVLPALEKYGERIWLVHFKDFQPDIARQVAENRWGYFEAIRHGIFCELGQGGIDFTGIVQWLKNTGYDGWVVVEQDILPGMGTPKESARRNREFLASMGI